MQVCAIITCGLSLAGVMHVGIFFPYTDFQWLLKPQVLQLYHIQINTVMGKRSSPTSICKQIILGDEETEQNYSKFVIINMLVQMRQTNIFYNHNFYNFFIYCVNVSHCPHLCDHDELAEETKNTEEKQENLSASSPAQHSGKYVSH